MTAPTSGHGPEFKPQSNLRLVDVTPELLALAIPVDERFEALALIRGAFHFAGRTMTDAEEEAFEGHILQAYRVGLRDAGDMAFRALEREGYTPSWKVLGGIRTIGLE